MAGLCEKLSKSQSCRELLHGSRRKPYDFPLIVPAKTEGAHPLGVDVTIRLKRPRP
jgi:hypothetical protein